MKTNARARVARSPYRAQGRCARPVLAAIAAAWAAALAAQLVGAALLHHDALIVDGPSPLLAALLFLLAWQVMIAAMMLPSSLPLVRLYARATASAPDAAAPWPLSWAVTRSSGARSGRCVRIRRGRARSGEVPGCTGTSGRSAASYWRWPAASSSALKDACLDKCRHPAQFLMRHYERGAVAASVSAPATAPSASVAAGR